eukprot:TRINITY_DN338_c0_g1_i1.p1 TRINITY_DN338_c0_g1~~TRINITY_DN338_c0_g1_i1.p1  ORF type:complete len:350 (-),score=98.24 TRINITY_DN338_c0_g1_i1:186-1235(-)
MCGSDPDKIERRQAKAVEAQLKKDKKQMEREIKLLLLGTGESGKSTIVKQMKIIHLNGFKSDDERREHRVVIYSNIIQSMKSLLKGAQKLSIPIARENEAIGERVLVGPSAGEHYTPDLARDIKKLWNDPGIKAAFARSAEFQLNDSAAFYLNDIDRISDPAFVPTVQDILRARVITTGIQETEFSYANVKFKMVDVGGQRNERRKWIHCFQEVTAIIFCVALSEYDQKLYEDETQNRMQESLLLFEEIMNSKWFANTSMILFLNKTDLFKEKIARVDLARFFPEYSGGLDYDRGLAFIKSKFLSLNKNPDKKKIYAHETCATDTRNVKFVFESVKDIIINANLSASGF